MRLRLSRKPVGDHPLAGPAIQPGPSVFAVIFADGMLDLYRGQENAAHSESRIKRHDKGGRHSV